MTTRDANGLTATQRRYLTLLAENPDSGAAAEAVGISARTPERWLREEEAYRSAYDNIFQGSVEVARRQAQLMSEKASRAIDDLLDEMKSIPVKCPDCGSKFEVEIRDSTVRARVAEMVWKATGVLKDIRRVEGEVVHLLTTEERLALLMLRKGKPISSQLYRELETRGLIPEEVKRPEDSDVIIEGESREV